MPDDEWAMVLNGLQSIGKDGARYVRDPVPTTESVTMTARMSDGKVITVDLVNCGQVTFSGSTVRERFSSKQFARENRTLTWEVEYAEAPIHVKVSEGDDTVKDK